MVWVTYGRTPQYDALASEFTTAEVIFNSSSPSRSIEARALF
jgi:hypothetical protein